MPQHTEFAGVLAAVATPFDAAGEEIGRASCRERV